VYIQYTVHTATVLCIIYCTSTYSYSTVYNVLYTQIVISQVAEEGNSLLLRGGVFSLDGSESIILEEAARLDVHSESAP